jgi:hypothetical protein
MLGSLSGRSEERQVRVSPICPVTDLPRALEHYRALGCHVSTHDEGYGFATRAATCSVSAPR